MESLLKTRRLCLRKFTRDDARYLHQLDNDPEVMRYINGGLPVSLDMIEDRVLATFVQYDMDRQGLGFWAVVDIHSSAFLGWVCLRPQQDDPATASIGYRFLLETWGQGYATEAAQALINLGFTELSLERVIATAYEKNQASRRVMDKLGLRFVKTFKVDIAMADTAIHDATDIWDGDDVEYALDRTDWRKLQCQPRQ
ncbi:MAG: GNAT family N-acetyltransferase [bacterium]|nr:N-acetyltransferase [Gammaproteobacteria bacterium]HIL96206.1 N-acetyltransferase [Pseudomonadales bacterium]